MGKDKGASSRKDKDMMGTTWSSWRPSRSNSDLIEATRKL